MNATIQSYLNSGLSVIPVKQDKRPIIKWSDYQKRLPTAEEASQWELPIAIVAGAVSGGLMCIDFDDNGSQFKHWGEIVKEVMPETAQKLVVQQTPSGGYHVIYRTTKVIENRKLAMRLDNGKVKVLIETRGEGGYFLATPSPGYTLKRGKFEEIGQLTEDEAHGLILIAIGLNQYLEDDMPNELAQPIQRNGISPFDDYDSKNTPIDTLIKHGWTVTHTSGDKIMLCRSGKKGSVSATWNHIPSRFYVFSTSTEFKHESLYKPSAVYAILEHRGDYTAAAKQLLKDGYGKPAIITGPVNVDDTPITQVVKISDFRNRIYAYYESSKSAGIRLGLHNFDDKLRFEKGYLNIVTGIPTSGKSEFVDFIMVKLACISHWNWVIFSPENYPLELHFNKLAEKYKSENMWHKPREYYDECIDFVDRHFSFVDATEDELCLDNILSACLSIPHQVDGLLIDPWNELEMQRPKEMSETEFTGVCLRKLRKFARKNNICLFLVVHPTKLQKNKDTGEYPVPTLYDCAGSAHFYNKADNGIVVHRDFTSNLVTVYIKKVKYKTHGRLGDVTFAYNVSNGIYTETQNQEDGFGSDPNNQ